MAQPAVTEQRWVSDRGEVQRGAGSLKEPLTERGNLRWPPGNSEVLFWREASGPWTWKWLGRQRLKEEPSDRLGFSGSPGAAQDGGGSPGPELRQ